VLVLVLMLVLVLVLVHLNRAGALGTVRWYAQGVGLVVLGEGTFDIRDLAAVNMSCLCMKSLCGMISTSPSSSASCVRLVL
jgi:hypothetical protein